MQTQRKPEPAPARPEPAPSVATAARPWTPAHPTEALMTPEALGRADLRNLGLIVLGFLALLLLIPPGHEFPVVDDWIYAGSVRDMLATGRFTMPDWSQ